MSFRGAAVANTQQYDAHRIGYKKDYVNLDLEISTDPELLAKEQINRLENLRKFQEVVGAQDGTAKF